MMTEAITFACTLLSLLVAHTIADHWVQTSHQSANKGTRDWSGAWNCFKHVASYTVVTAAFVALVWSLLDLEITPAGFICSQLVSAVTHYWADRRFTLAWLARIARLAGFYTLGAPPRRAQRQPQPRHRGLHPRPVVPLAVAVRRRPNRRPGLIRQMPDPRQPVNPSTRKRSQL